MFSDLSNLIMFVTYIKERIIISDGIILIKLIIFVVGFFFPIFWLHYEGILYVDPSIMYRPRAACHRR